MTTWTPENETPTTSWNSQTQSGTFLLARGSNKGEIIARWSNINEDILVSKGNDFARWQDEVATPTTVWS